MNEKAIELIRKLMLELHTSTGMLVTKIECEWTFDRYSGKINNLRIDKIKTEAIG